MTEDIYTIGHSNHSWERFLSLLEQHSIECIADVRSHPASRFVPHFNKKTLAERLEKHGIEYVFLGKELGGRPREQEFYGENATVLYEQLAASERFLQGLEHLVGLIKTRRTVIMCAEADPERCHRSMLIEPALTGRGFHVIHILKDGTLQQTPKQ